VLGAIYGHPDAVELSAIAAGLKTLGTRCSWENIAAWNESRVEKVDLMVLSGMREIGARIARAYAARGIPILVIDYGYLRRVQDARHWYTRYWQLGWGRLNSIPDGYCPPDRFLSLGLDIAPFLDILPNAVLVCGQAPLDPSHRGLSCDTWAFDTIRRLKMEGHRVIWRPHPQTVRPNVELGADEVSCGVPIEWDLQRVGQVVTVNSNAGHDALLAGVPVRCDRSAPYSALSVSRHRNGHPTISERLLYFSRVAYAQWTLAEIESGFALQYMMKEAACAY
jgi:hypothetical protein